MRKTSVAFLVLMAACLQACGKAEKKGDPQERRVIANREIPPGERVDAEAAAHGDAADAVERLAGYVGGPNTPGEPVFAPGTDGATFADDMDVEVAAGEISAEPEGEGPPPAPGEAGKQAPKKKSKRTWKRAQIVPNTTRLSIGDDEDLPLQALQATVRVDGFRARVVLDCLYRNHTKDQLEGTFKLRLPEGASPYYLAFGAMKLERPKLTEMPDVGLLSIRTQRRETWHKPPKEARVVPKEKAAHAYGETVRRRIDPALLEGAGAGVFSARVFPLEPEKLHRIVVGYEVNLLRVGDDLEYRLDLPERIPQLRVDISTDGDAVVTPATRGSRGRYSWANPVERSFVVRLREPGAVLLHGGDAAGARFAAQFRPEVPESAAAPSKRAVFLVDVSLSSNPERFNVWLKLLREMLDRNRPALEEFAVLFFNVETFGWRTGFAPNTPANVKELLDFAGTLALEGATDLGQALASTRGLEGPYDLFLLSDGSPTWGEDDLHALSKQVAGGPALFAYTTGFSGTDKRVLDHLTRETGGAVFSVVNDAEVPKAALAHTRRPWRIRSLSIDGGTSLLAAGRPKALFPGQTLLLAGRGKPKPDAGIVLTLEQAGRTREIRTPVGRSIESDLATGVYGQIAVAQLEELGHATADVAKAYATHYRVVGRTCSLLMLETEEDYEAFGIVPEQDEQVVRDRPADRVVAKTLSELGASLSDPRARFGAWLGKLERMPGLELEIPGALREALRRMPRESFEVEPAPLACKARLWKDVPGAVQEQLASRNLTYDALHAEALRRKQKLGADDALKVLSSLVEASPGDLALARDVAFTAREWGSGGQAYHLYRRAAHKRPFEPQTYRAMAACLTGLQKTDLALLNYEIAVLAQWPERFGAFTRIAAVDYVRFLREIEAGRLKTSVPAFAKRRLGELAEALELNGADLLVSIAWNTDRTDVDLHVEDPNGEVCKYDHKETRIGGAITADVTQGYGPEMFVLRKAIPGDYVVRVKYFSSDRNRVSARTRVFVTVYQNWGRPDERALHKAVTLAYGKEVHEVARIRR